jgi:prevent-host-death family protein
MKSWKLSEAKARLSEVVGSCVEEPQVLYNRRKPVAALISMDEFREFEAYRKSRLRPSMAECIDEIAAINKHEPDLDPPARHDREVPDLG